MGGPALTVVSLWLYEEEPLPKRTTLLFPCRLPVGSTTPTTPVVPGPRVRGSNVLPGVFPCDSNAEFRTRPGEGRPPGTLSG